MRTFIKFLALSTISLQATYTMQTWQETTKAGEIITFEHVTAGDLKEERELMFRTFKSRYEGRVAPEVLEPLLAEGFSNITNAVSQKKPNFYLITAKRQGQLCGLAFFEQRPSKTILWEIVVDPQLQRLGIGKLLIFSIVKAAPNTKKITLASRKENLEAHAFYTALGFQQTQALDPDDVVGDNPGASYGFEYTVQR